MLSENDLEFREHLHLPEDLIKALGKVTAHYGQTEHVLCLTVARTGKFTYEQAFAEFNEIKTDRRRQSRKKVRDAYRDLAIRERGDEQGPKDAKEFNRLLDKWTHLANERDDVVHCDWSVGTDGEVSGTRRGCLLVDKKGSPLGIRDVQTLANNLAQILVLLNMATRPEFVSGWEEAISKIPATYKPGWVPPPGLEIGSTAASTESLTTTVVGSKGRGS